MVSNLLDLALLASQEETDDETEADGQEESPPIGGPSISSTIPVERSAVQGKDDACTGSCHKVLKSTNFDFANSRTTEQITDFIHIIQQLPVNATELSPEEIERAGLLYESLAQGPAFRRAKSAGLSYPELPRPYIDQDGWKLTGVVNEFGEEIVEVDRQNWISTSAQSKQSHPPLRRLKRKSQLELEQIFGYPPLAGDSNEPLHKRKSLEEENVAYEKYMLDICRAAEARGLPCGRDLSWERLAESIKAFDASQGIRHEPAPGEDVPGNIPGDRDDDLSSWREFSEGFDLEGDEDSDYKPDEMAENDIDAAPPSSLVAGRERRGALRKLKGRKSPFSTPAPGNPNSSDRSDPLSRPMDIASIVSVSQRPLRPFE